MRKRWILLAAVATLCLSTRTAGADNANDLQGKPKPPEEKKIINTFGDKVEDEVDKACDWLKRQQNPNGIFGKFDENQPLYQAGTPHRYEVGRTAFPIWALCKSGVFYNDPEIERGMKWLRQNYANYADQGKTTTYECACVTNAVEAYYISKWETQQAKLDDPAKRKKEGIKRWGTEEAGAKKAKAKAKAVKRVLSLSNEDRNLATRATKSLTDAYRKAYGFGGWRYKKDSTEPGGKIDCSASQFTVMGLTASSRLGLKYDKSILFDVIAFYLDEQDKDGPEIQRQEKDKDNPDADKPEDKPKDPNKATDSRKYAPREKDRARGWGYNRREPHQPIDSISYGSMTCAGICALIIMRDELESDPAYKARYNSLYGPPKGQKVGKIDQAIYDGLAWLVTNWSVEGNPKAGRYRYYYYLYMIERVGMLGGVDFIGDHDWYMDGALIILDDQKPGDPIGGYWNTETEIKPTEIYDTCYALLFLKRATDAVDRPVPVITGRDG